MTRQQSTLLLMNGIFTALMLVLILSWLTPQADYPEARQGVLNAKGWDFARQGPIPLSGEWEFYEGKLLGPEAFGSDRSPGVPTYIKVPGSFARDGGADFGTYRLKVGVSASDLYSIRAKKVRLSSHVYVNGEDLGGNGRSSRSAADFIPSNLPFLGTVSAAVGSVEILIQVASFDNLAGGLVQVPEFGRAEDILEQRDHARLSDMILVTALLVFGLYYAGMFRHWRREPHLMYFSLFCLTLGVFFSIDNEILLAAMFPSLPFLWLQKLLWILPTICFFFFMLYIYQYIGKMGNRLVKFTTMLMCAYMLLILFMPNRYYGNIFGINALLPTFYFATIFTVIIKSRRRGIQGTGFLLLGVFSLLTMWIYAQLRYLFALDTPYYMVFSPLMIVISQALLMTDRLHDAYMKNEKLNKQLIAYDRQKDEFLAKTSHELRTPLHGIINLSQMLLDDGDRPLHPAHRDNILLLHQVGRRLAGLVHDILDMNKIRYGQLSIHYNPVDIGMSVRFVIETLSLVKDKPNVRLVNGIPGGLPYVWADENRIRQILHNLMENAIKFTSHGTVSVSAAVRGREIAVSVTDTGSGIPPDMLETLFRPFSSWGEEGEGWRSGLGLGLSISRKLVELQNGRMEVDTKVGGGSTFTFTLPIAADMDVVYKDEAAAAAVPERKVEPHAESARESNRMGGCHLLIVDDELSNRKILTDTAEALKYGYTAVASGEEALAALRRSQRPDVVLLDVMMPGVSGLDVCREIRKLHSLAEMPVLMLTASGQTGDLIAAFAAGANDILQKPFELAELRARLHSLLAMKVSSANAVQREMDYLQAQITPHFLYNSLNALIGLSYKDTDKLRDTIEHLSTYLRAKFTFVFDSELVTFGRELELVKAYLAIEQLRFGERLQVSYRIEDNFDCLLPPLILQPIVENAVRHGVGPKSGMGVVEIAARLIDGGAEITVTDDGMGIDGERLQALEEGKAGGVGIDNVNRRLLMLYGRKLEIQSETGAGTRVRLYLTEEDHND
ncbi:hybrid sensor histidine kinase/response regulator [Paenibacillus nasutitermitis]|uniref:histidine kinase n=1 Tax=Paenibacillus nasutitermitis TaxID=1652958 RepID=A0A916ZD00_9BACL|nr:ATP-binding protein [Paenibacillus nasutitermitis]GGD89086.1 hypothetical protein GCM10010911_54600 [Paenibacillus nasutitermitis]